MMVAGPFGVVVGAAVPVVEVVHPTIAVVAITTRARARYAGRMRQGARFCRPAKYKPMTPATAAKASHGTEGAWGRSGRVGGITPAVVVRVSVVLPDVLPAAVLDGFIVHDVALREPGTLHV